MAGGGLFRCNLFISFPLQILPDIDDFYSQCDPEKENLCLYGHLTESWEVNLPAEEVPPEPALGINFVRDGMQRKDWLSLVAVHSDCHVVAAVDVIHVTHAAVATAGTTAGIGNEETNMMMQKFWDSAMELSPSEEDEDTRSESSLKVASEAETGKSFPLANTFSFKMEVKNHRMHRFISDTRSLTEAMRLQRQRMQEMEQLETKITPTITIIAQLKPLQL